MAVMRHDPSAGSIATEAIVVSGIEILRNSRGARIGALRAVSDAARNSADVAAAKRPKAAFTTPNEIVRIRGECIKD